MIDFFGLIGLVLLLLSFTLLETGKLKAGSWEYLMMNLLGAGLLGWYAWTKGAYIFVVLEAFWVVVAGYELKFAGGGNKKRKTRAAKKK